MVGINDSTDQYGHAWAFLLTVILLISALALSGCASRIELGEFEPYYRAFQHEAKVRGRQTDPRRLVIRFGRTTPAHATSTCYLRPDLGRYVAVNQAQWEREQDELFRELLIFHELGHCLLGREHSSGTYADGIPHSIMHYAGVPVKLYRQRREKYLNELFENS